MPTTDEVHDTILLAIIGCRTENKYGNTSAVISDVDNATAVRDAVFQALADKGMLNLDGKG